MPCNYEAAVKMLPKLCPGAEARLGPSRSDVQEGSSRSLTSMISKLPSTSSFHSGASATFDEGNTDSRICRLPFNPSLQLSRQTVCVDHVSVQQ